jgi:hypothetical protein
MKTKISVKSTILAGFTGLSLLTSVSAFAVYPAYQQQQYQPQYQQQYKQATSNNYRAVTQFGQMPQAASAQRITGQLPKIGSNYVNAGRQYYQPETLDRLADSGL